MKLSWLTSLPDGRARPNENLEVTGQETPMKSLAPLIGHTSIAYTENSLPFPSSHFFLVTILAIS